MGTAITNNSPSNSGGAPTVYSVSPVLPAGLTLNTGTGVISGTPTVAIAAANYTVTASNSCGTTTKVVNITVVASPASITYTLNPAVYCSGTPIAANSPAITGGTPTSYSVSPALPAGLVFSTTTGIISGTPTVPTAAANYTVTATNSCGSANVAVNITISPAAPTALNYTLTPATYCGGTAITNNSPSNTGGAPTAYSVSPALPAGLSLNAGTGVISGTPTVGSAATNYTVTASNFCGTTNKVINITVNTGASISSQPGNQSTCAGTAKTFSVTASGTSPTYQWQYSPDNATWSNVANGTPGNITYTNGTTNTLTVTPSAAAANGTYYYRCVVSVNGCSVLNSNSATLTVSATPTTSVAGTNQTICTTTASTTLAANTPVNGTGTWSVSSGPSLLASQFSDVNSPTATFTPAGGAGTYALLWTISNGPCTNSSDFVNIIVNTAPSISSQPANQTTCAGTAKTFSVTASGTSPTYQWQYSRIILHGLM